MPRLKSNRQRDPLKGLILEYKAQLGLSNKEMANIWKVSCVTCSKRLNDEHTDKWLTEAKVLCKKMNVPIDEFRQAVRY